MQKIKNKIKFQISDKWVIEYIHTHLLNQHKWVTHFDPFIKGLILYTLSVYALSPLDI